MKGLVGIAIFGASVIGVMLAAPLVLTAADRVTGGWFGAALDATLGRATEEISGLRAEDEFGFESAKSVSGARLVRLQ